MYHYAYTAVNIHVNNMNTLGKYTELHHPCQYLKFK